MENSSVERGDKSMNTHDFTVKAADSSDVKLADVKGPMLIVNVASKCGFTPQYEGLEALHREYGPKGLTVLGFPCNQFGGQEPGNADEIANFCSLTYNVSFPVLAKVEVNGDAAEPLSIKWNFTKFLVDKDGRVVSRHAPTEKPESLKPAIEKLLT
jgi:glutathione peroxidase